MDEKLLRILGGDAQHYPHALERKFPRILATLMMLWDTPEASNYLDKLMVDDRASRAGFPPDVAAELVHLSLVHAGQYHKENRRDVWSPEARLFTAFDPVASQRNVTTWPEIPHETAGLIQSLGIACSPDGYFRAVAAGKFRIVALFLEAGVPIETRNEDGWTALMLAVYNGQDELAELLIREGAKVDARENGGNTSLHWAAFSGKSGCCKLLVENKAEVDARSNFGWTPFYQSVARNHLNVAAYLLTHHADVNASAKDGQTPLHKACAAGALDMIKLLLSHHADTQLTNQLGETPLALATKNHQEQAAALLISAA